MAFGGVLFGYGQLLLAQQVLEVSNGAIRYDTGTISGIIGMKYWEKEFATTSDHQVTSSQQSLIVSILSAGTFFGALFAAPIADLIGRRFGLMFSAGVVFNLGVILQAAATAQPLFVAGRFFAGLGVGLVSAMSKRPPHSRRPHHI